MKIAYVFQWEAHWGQGILKKVLSHVRAWTGAGCDVRIFMLSPDEHVQEMVGQSDPDIALVVRRHHNLADRIIQYGPLAQMVAAWQPDIVFLRYAGYFPALAALARQFPLVMEINTDDITEYRLMSPYHNVYNRLTRRLLFERAKGLVFVTHELSRLPSFTCFGKPGAVIANGIDLGQYQPTPPPANPSPRLAFIGSVGAPWHGVDKIRLLAEQHPEWAFDIIGSPAAELLGPVPPNVCMHGLLDRERYEPILARSDVAIGTLALHRKQMHEAAPLKVREYLALGLPLIIAYADTDLSQPHEAILQLPNTPDNVSANIEAIRSFVLRVKGTRIPRAQIAHLDGGQKEQRRLAFFRSLLPTI